MRPRIRTYKPEIFKHERLWDLEQETGRPLFRAFLGLIACADREGRFPWRPRALKSDILPYWEGDFEEVLYDLARAGFIVTYTVDGRDYGCVPSLPEHQRIDHHEPQSELPAPPDDLARPSEVPPVPANDARACPENAPPEGKGRERKGTEGKGREIAREPQAPPPEPRSRTRLVPLPAPDRPERTYSLPSPEPPTAYLDEALMAGVPRDRATSTWRHYHGAGLPERGVERLHSWLVQRAKEHAEGLTGPRSAPLRRQRGEPANAFEQQAERVRMLRQQEGGS